MKHVQISETLFVALVKYHLLDDESQDSIIHHELEAKMDKIVLREYYSQSKTAKDETERETARQKYLEAKGITKSFRW